MRKLIVMGGGVTGLSAAYYALKQCKHNELNIYIQIIEQASRYGGKINTVQSNGFTIEKGPDSFLARKKPIIDLSLELGISEQFVAMNSHAKKTYIVRNNQLHPFPAGLMLGIPTQFRSFLQSSAISTSGKLRAMIHYLWPEKVATRDQSIGQLLRRRFGSEVVDVLVEPILAGIYASDLNQLSVQATFPSLQRSASESPNMVNRIMQQMAKSTQSSSSLPIALQGSTFLSFQGGLHTLVRALLDHLDGVELRNAMKVTRISRKQDQLQVTYDDGSQDTADAIICTLPPHEAAQVIDHPLVSDQLRQIPSISVAHVVFIYEAAHIRQPLDGTGFVVPRIEQKTITACTWTSIKWPHTAPQDKLMLRCYVGRSGDEQWVNWTDDQIISRVKQDLFSIMHIDAEPLSIELTRMPHSMPQYLVGHLEHVAQIKHHLHTDMPGMYVTGAGYHGVGLPDCIEQAKQTAHQVIADHLEK
jgi:oxygen-dependent protoporphyrinogen oxidase